MRFSTVVIKSLRRRPIRSALTTLGIGLAVAAVVALVGVALRFQDSYFELYEHREVDLVVVRAGATERITSALDEQFGDAIASLSGVTNVTPSLTDVVSFEDLDLFGVVIQGWKPDSFLFDDLTITGRKFTDGEQRVLLLGDVLARNLDKHVGDVVEVVEDEEFTVIGIYSSFSVFENTAMVVPFTELQRLMGREGQVTSFTVSVEDPTDADAVANLRAAIEGLGAGITAMPTEDYVLTDNQLRMAKSMAGLTSTIALFVGTIGMLNTMFMSVFERTGEIGLLRAIGWRRPRIVALILGESVLLAILGAFLGTFLAILAVAALGRVPAVSSLVEGSVSPFVVALGFGLSLVVAFVGGAYPAYRGAKLLPTEALRHE